MEAGLQALDGKLRVLVMRRGHEDRVTLTAFDKLASLPVDRDARRQ